MSIAKNPTGPRKPQRKRGQQRVAALLKAAGAVFAERGYAGATMTEIAQRAKAPIGSLYQFFPNKEVLGAALMQRFLELCVQALTAIEEKLQTLSPDALANALLDVFIDLKQERAAAIAIADSQPHKPDTRPSEFRQTMLRHLVQILRAKRPDLTRARADAMALAVLQQMKTAVALHAHTDAESAASTLHELREMLQLYLQRNIGEAAPKPLRKKS
jgi:AcrR family transcriptional regulator